jgi:hypothetical protein
MPTNKRVVYDCVKEKLELRSPLLDELGIFISLLPEMGLREIRHVLLYQLFTYFFFTQSMVVLLQVLKAKTTHVYLVLDGILKLKIVDYVITDPFIRWNNQNELLVDVHIYNEISYVWVQ